MRASTVAVAFALLLGCGGGGSPTSSTEQPLSVQLRETATLLSVTTEMPASSGHSKFEARAMNFTFNAKVDEGPNAGKSISGRLELKGQREDDGVIEVEGRLFPDVSPSLPTPADLKDKFDADRKALQAAMREDIKVLGEELRAAIAGGTPHKDALAAFKTKFEARMAKFRADLSALIAEFRAARRAGGGHDDDDDNAAKGFEVRGTIAADGSIDVMIDLGSAGKVHAIGKLAGDSASASGTFTGPASGDKGKWSASANAGTPPPPPPPSGGTYEAGLAKYNAMCAGCHSAGKVDTTGTAGDLAKDIDDIVSDLGRIDKAMQGLVLSAQDILDLKAFLRQANNPPSPPPTGNCAANANVSWTQGASTCNASYAGGGNGSSVTLTDSTGPTTGSATASCSNGTMTVTSPTCTTATTPAPCAANSNLSWSVGGSTCNASYAGGASGSSVTLTDSTGPTTGSATASCSNGTVNLSAQTCTTATTPAPCAADGNVTWSVGGSTCNASYAGGASGSSMTLTDSTGPTTGSATASCSNGTMTLSAQTCTTATTPAPCAANSNVTWSVGGSTCNASYPGGASGSSLTLTDSTAPTTGSATASCSNGTMSLSAQTCTTAPTCTLPTAVPTCVSCHGGAAIYPASHAGRPMTCASCHTSITATATASGSSCVLNYPTNTGTHGNGRVDF